MSWVSLRRWAFRYVLHMHALCRSSHVPVAFCTFRRDKRTSFVETCVPSNFRVYGGPRERSGICSHHENAIVVDNVCARCTFAQALAAPQHMLGRVEKNGLPARSAEAGQRRINTLRISRIACRRCESNSTLENASKWKCSYCSPP
jgi:hypothetical protein